MEYNYNHCNESSFSFTNNSVDLIKVEKEYEMTLICRDPDGMTIRIRAEHDDQYRVFVLLINDVNGNEILGSTRVNIVSSEKLKSYSNNLLTSAVVLSSSDRQTIQLLLLKIWTPTLSTT